MYFREVRFYWHEAGKKGTYVVQMYLLFHVFHQVIVD